MRDKFKILIAGVVATNLLLTGVIFWQLREVSQKISSLDSGIPGSTRFIPINTEGEPFIGKKDAPLTIAYWFDFQCPFCKKFDMEVLPQIIKDYVEPGKVKIVFKDFQFLGPDSITASLFAHAIWELYPDKYFEWQTEMFKAQDEENGGFGDKESILRLIEEKFPEMDRDRLVQLIEEKREEYIKEMNQDRDEAIGEAIQGTPGFVIGETVITGARPYPTFKKAIDKALRQLGVISAEP